MLASSRSNPIQSTSSSSPSLPIKTLPDNENRANYPKVRFWMEVEWTEWVEKCRRKGEHIDKLGFLTDSDGAPLSKTRSKRISGVAKMNWNEMKQHSMHPSSWKKKTSKAQEFFKHQMMTEFPEFRLADNDWKLEQFAIVRYPDWIASLRKEEVSDRLTDVDRSSKRRSDEHDQNQHKPKKRPNHSSPPDDARILSIDNDAMEPSDTSSSPVDPQSPKALSVLDPTGLAPQLPAPVDQIPAPTPQISAPAPQIPIPAPQTPAATQMTVPAAQVSVPTTQVSTLTTHTSPAQVFPPAAMHSATPIMQNTIECPSSTAPNENNFCTAPSSGPPRFHRPMTRRVLDPLKNLSIPPPSVTVVQNADPTLPSLAKKPISKPLQAKDGLTTARNLYAIDYLKMHPDTTESEFSASWKMCDAETKKKYQELSKERTKAKKNPPQHTATQAHDMPSQGKRIKLTLTVSNLCASSIQVSYYVFDLRGIVQIPKASDKTSSIQNDSE
ncbi:hypothetical protein C0992_012054 [Termitomyces sp. T32_za158]|nr:hypothetical protein C0992_012054 [Termitomyces sp. T32_za158]